jgi:very-short-patch-repair endonuclease
MSPTHKAKIEAQLKEETGNRLKAVKRVEASAGSKLSGDGSFVTDSEKGSKPQRQLWNLLHVDDVCSQFSWESDFVGAVPGRKFELDIACKALKIGTEIDGWLWHGKRKQDFLRDREKDYLLMLEGWQVLRIQAGLIYKDPQEALTRVRKFLEICVPRQQLLLSSDY